MRSSPLAFMITLLLAAPAHADDAPQARAHFNKGSAFFDVGRFAEAASEYEQAYQLKNDPALLFNLGQAYRFDGQYAKAIVAYKSFLRRVPNASHAVEVQQHIASLQKLLDEQKRATTTPPTGTLPPAQAEPEAQPPPSTSRSHAPSPVTPSEATVAARPSPRPTPLYKKWWLWRAVGGVVVAGVAVGLGLGLTARAPGTSLPSVTF